MKIVHRLAVATAVGLALSWVPVTSASAAGPMVATVGDSQSAEYELECDGTPGPCTLQYARRLVFRISVSNFSGSPITFGYQVQGITATAGQDYVPWPYAPPDVVTTDSYGYATVAVDLVNDGLVEPTETARVRLTSTSRPVTITDTGLGTIFDGHQLPPDCSLTRVDDKTGTMTCTARPAGQRWQLEARCSGWAWFTIGNVVTGNGTSSGTCSGGRWFLGSEITFNLAP